MDEERVEGEVREETPTGDTREGGPEGATVETPADDATGERPTEGAGTTEAGTGAPVGAEDPPEQPAAPEPGEGAADPEDAASTIPPLPADGGEDAGASVPWRSVSRWVAAHVPATVAIVACALAAIAVVVVALSAGTPEELDRNVTHNGLSIDVPESWSVEGAENGDLETPYYVYPDFPGLVMFQANQMVGNLNDSLMEEYVEGLESEGLFHVVGKPTATDVDGRPAYTMRVTGTVDGDDYQGGITIVTFDGCMSAVMAMAGDEATPSQKRTMEAVLGSVGVASNPKQVTVTFKSEGKEVSTKKVAVFGASSVEAPTVERDDATLVGWDVADGDATVTKTDDGFVVSGIEGDVTCEAEWKPLWKVTFTDGEGKVLETVYVADGQAAKAPANPTRSGYDFAGWEGDFSKVTQDVEVKAKWVKQATLGERNALAKAKSYLAYSSFSYTKLIRQLEHEGFSNEEATYAVDHCGADWNEQAAKKAESYMSYSSFSRDRLIRQLEHEGFTAEQAEYGAKSVGY